MLLLVSNDYLLKVSECRSRSQRHLLSQFGNLEAVLLGLNSKHLSCILQLKLFVAELFILLVKQLLHCLDHLGGSLCHLLSLLLMSLVERILLSLNGIVQHLVLTEVLVSELPLAELLDNGILLSVVFEGLVQLLPHLSDLAFVNLSVIIGLGGHGVESRLLESNWRLGLLVPWLSLLVNLRGRRVLDSAVTEGVCRLGRLGSLRGEVIVAGVKETLHALVVCTPEFFFTLVHTRFKLCYTLLQVLHCLSRGT